jgi:hypothetical protein
MFPGCGAHMVIVAQTQQQEFINNEHGYVSIKYLGKLKFEFQEFLHHEIALFEFFQLFKNVNLVFSLWTVQNQSWGRIWPQAAVCHP